MTEPSLEIRAMSRAELDIAIDWAAAEGWNPGLADGDCFHAADPDGFLVGILDRAPVASLSAVTYGPDYGFLGFYIVAPEHRGKGFGLQIWRAGMARLGDRLVGLDGVVDQQPNYRRSGFELAHRSVRYGGTVDIAGQAPEGMVDAATLPFEALRAYDAPFFPAPREAFLRCWLAPDRRVARALVRDGAVAGYGVIRACRAGYKVGPLFADDADGAEALFRALAGTVEPGAAVYLDPPETNPEAVALAQRHGLAPVFETARMYTGPAPDLPLARTFGITTFELG